MKNRLTPVSILEEFFHMQLKKKTIEFFQEISSDKWVDFSKFYLFRMKEGFKKEHFLSSNSEGHLRLYFEPKLYDQYTSIIEKQYTPTPLLGERPHPPHDRKISSGEISKMLNPLKKHLLFSNSIYIRDNFYYCFDMVADSVNSQDWRNNPTHVYLVERSINSVINWLPILCEIRTLIDTGSIVFMPYYFTPSFPYSGYSPSVKKSWNRIFYEKGSETTESEEIYDSYGNRKPAYYFKSSGIGEPYFSEEVIKMTWLNSRILNLSPVYPTKNMLNYASKLRFTEDLAPRVNIADFTSINILPFGNEQEISIRDLIKIRNNEEVFKEVAKSIIALKNMIEKENLSATSDETRRLYCKGYLQEQLSILEQKSIIKFVRNPITGISLSFMVGSMLLTSNPLISLFAGTASSAIPSVADKLLMNKKQKAIGHIQMLL